MVEEAPGTGAAGEAGGGGNGALIGVAIVLLLGAAGGILWWVTRKPPELPTQKADTSQSASASTAPPATTLDLPPIDLPVDAGPDIGGVDSGGSKTPGVAYSGCPATCTGVITDAIRAATAARAGTAKQCYKTALEGNEGLAGDVVVMLRVGLDGTTCSSTVVSNTTNSQRLSGCVRSKMIATYPAPKGGCVDVKVPITFKPKS